MIIKRLDLTALPSSPTRKGVLPDSPVVYIILDDKTIFYVGATKSLLRRLAVHANEHRLLKKVLNARKTKVAWIALPIEQLGSSEYALIRFLNPKFNFCKHRNSAYNPQVATGKRKKPARYTRLEGSPASQNGNGHK